MEQFLYRGGGDGVEGRSGFIEKQDFRLHGDGPGNAKSLLLATGEERPFFSEGVLYFVPEGDPGEGMFYDPVPVGLGQFDPVKLITGDHITVIPQARQGIVPLT